MKIYDIMKSGLCDIIICADEEKIYSVKIKDPAIQLNQDFSSNILTTKTKEQIKEYLIGKRYGFDLPIHMDFSVFQKKVYDKIKNISYGLTSTSGKIAIELGEFNYFRSVRGAADRNNFFLIVPCHRVIRDEMYEECESFMGKNDEYYLGIKKALLELESNTDV